jgi:hypothetical protein
MQRFTLLGILIAFTWVLGPSFNSTALAKEKAGAKKAGAKQAKSADRWKIANGIVWAQLQTNRTAANFKKLDANGSDKLERIEFHKVLKQSAKGKANKKKKGRANNKANNKKAELVPSAPAPYVFIAAQKKNADAKKNAAAKKKADAKKKPASKGGLGGSGIDMKKWTDLGGPDRFFDKLDTNKDNTLSKDEFVLGKGAAGKEAKPGDKKKAGDKKAKKA